jgi:sugar phosphate isomerase/epimerase
LAAWRARGRLVYSERSDQSISHAQEKPTMMFNPETQPLSRRQVLKFAALGAAAAVAPRRVRASDEKDPYVGLKMGMQSYSLRAFDTPTALRHTKEFGLKYWESFPKHIPLSTLPKQVAESKALLKDNGITLMGYGVVDFDGNETKARQTFDFAKAIGLFSISCNPKKDKATFDLLDKLVAEYDIPIGIHNHGPHARYSKISDVADIVKDRHPKIGACVDMGHYLRSDESPVEALERLGNRLYGVHLKDVRTINEGDRRKKIFTIIGQGDLDIPGCLRTLKKLNYQGCLSLEYEENEQNPLSDIAVSLQAVREAAAKLS